jgi:hypothetical protein
MYSSARGGLSTISYLDIIAVGSCLVSGKVAKGLFSAQQYFGGWNWPVLLGTILINKTLPLSLNLKTVTLCLSLPPDPGQTQTFPTTSRSMAFCPCFRPNSQYRYAIPILVSFRNLFLRSWTTIDVIIVLPAPGMPGQNIVCLSWLTHSWNSFDLSSHSPVPSWCLAIKSLCRGE